MSVDAVVIEREVFVAAQPQTVFRFLIDPALMADWIGAGHQLEPELGGLVRIQFSQGDVASGHFAEIVPHKRVAFTWGWEAGHEGQSMNLTVLPPGASLVEIDLEAKQGGTLVRLRHSHVPKTIAQRHYERWSHYLEQLAAAASTFADREKTSNDLAVGVNTQAALHKRR